MSLQTKRKNTTKRAISSISGLVIIVVASALYLIGGAGIASAATAVPLGAATTFGVFGNAAVTNTGFSTVSQDLASLTACTGFVNSPPCTLGTGVVTGTAHVGDATAAAVHSAVGTAYTSLLAQPCTATITTDLGGLVLTPGVYCIAAAATLTGTLLLNAQFDPNAVWIFKIGTTLTTAAASSVAVINGGNVCNAFWGIGTSATIGAGTQFGGTLIATTTITFGDSANVVGRALARDAAVTMINNNISMLTCGQQVSSTSTSTSTVTSTTTITSTTTSTTTITSTTTHSCHPEREDERDPQSSASTKTMECEEE